MFTSDTWWKVFVVWGEKWEHDFPHHLDEALVCGEHESSEWCTFRSEQPTSINLFICSLIAVWSGSSKCLIFFHIKVINVQRGVINQKFELFNVQEILGIMFWCRHIFNNEDIVFEDPVFSACENTICHSLVGVETRSQENHLLQSLSGTIDHHHMK